MITAGKGLYLGMQLHLYSIPTSRQLCTPQSCDT